MKTATPTAEDYARAFEAERLREYPIVDAFEARMGYALDRQKLEAAARVLACPVKANPPCWQHGRVLYAAARAYLQGKPSGCWTFLDVGTAKGFSALCLQWALMDHAGGAITSGVTSVDVIEPRDHVRRNTVAEIDSYGYLTLRETLAQWPEAEWIAFWKSTGVDWLQHYTAQIHVAFIDGKHTGPTVAKEGWLLSQRQETGDLAIFDDVHLPEIAKAVNGLAEQYAIERIDVLPTRAYAVAVKR